MGRSRQKGVAMASGYTRQFRDQAVKLVTERGYAPSTAARELGMPDSTLVQWLKKAGWKPLRESDPDAALPEDPKALAAQVRELRRQVKRLEMEKEILKKATAYFASQSP